MTQPGIVIANAGLITPIGLSLAETAASARARVARLREIAWLDRRFEPFIVGSVPDAGLPDIAPALREAPLQYRESRMLQLAHSALEEALAPLAGKAGPVPLLLGLPEHHTTLPLEPDRFLARLSAQLPGTLDVDASLTAARGRASALLALQVAGEWLSTGAHPFVLVGGVDSLVDLYVLGTLDAQARIRNEINNDGFVPSEGAAFLLLTRADTAQAAGLNPLALLQGAGQGQEAGHLYAQAPYLGDGLAAAFSGLLDATPPAQAIGCVYCSFNGERYWAREFGVARTRNAAAFAPDQTMEHPAECFGDLGAAHGAALIALAAHGVQQGYRSSPCLVYASSDHGDRGATLVDRLQ